MQRIFKRFRELLDTPAPAQGSYLRWGTNSTLENASLDPGVQVSLSGNTSGTLTIISSGTLTLAGGSNVTLSQAGNAVTIVAPSQTVQTQNMVSVNGSTGSIVIVGGNNVTLSQTQSTISINAGGGGVNIAASNTTYTSGSVIFAGSNQATVKSGTNQQVIIDVSVSQSVQTQNMVSVNGSTGNISFSNANNVTFGANGSTITASASYSQSTAPGAIAASNTTYTSGTVIITGSNAVTVKSDTNQRIVIDAPAQSVQTQGLIQAAVVSGNTSGTMATISSGTMTLAGGNNLVISQAGNAITASVSSTPTFAEVSLVSGASSYGGAKELIDYRKLPRGFPNRTDSTISFVYASRIFTIAPSAASFIFYNQGIKFVKSGSDTVTIPNADGLYFIYYDSTGTLQQSTGAWDLSIHTPIALVYYNTTVANYILFEERHTPVLDWAAHTDLHVNIGTYVLGSGFDLTGYTVNTDTLAGVTFAISSGTIVDEDLFHTIATLTDNQGVGNQYPIFFKLGAAGRWDWLVQNLPYDYLTSTAAYWNQNNAGTWQKTALTTGGAGTWTNYYLCAVAVASASSSLRYAFVMGQTSFTSLANAQAESFLSLNLTGLPFAEVAPLWKITVHSRNTWSTTTHQTVIAGVTKIVGTRVSVSINNPAIGVHNALAGRDVFPAHPVDAIDFAGGGLDGQVLAYNTNATVQNSAKFEYVPRAIVISSNTSGTTASVSSGTMVLAGGNNITLSQNSNSITISAQSQSVQTQGLVSINGSTGNISFSNANNVTFGANGSTITASASYSQSTAPAAIAGSNTTYTSGTIVITGSNLVTVKSSGAGQTIIIDATSAAQTVQTQNVVVPAASNTTLTSGTVVFTGSNNITVSYNGQTIQISGANTHAQQTGISGFGANATTFTSGTVVLSNFNNVSFGTSGAGANQTITASASYSQSTAPSGIAGSNTTYTSGNVEFTGSGAVTIRSSAGQRIVVDAPTQSIQTQNIVIPAASNSTYTSGTVVFTGSNNVTVSYNGQTIQISGANTHAQQTAISGLGGSNTTYTSGTVVLSGSNNITVSSSAANQTLIIQGPANILNSLSISGNTATTNSSNITGGGFVLAGGSNITLEQNNNTISISGHGSIGISAGTNSRNTGTVSFANSNGVTFGMDTNGVITATVIPGAAAGIGAIEADGTTYTSGTVTIVGSQNVTVTSGTGQRVIVQGPANILNSMSISGNTGTTNSSAITGGGFVLAGGDNVTLLQSNNTISVSAAGAPADVTMSQWPPNPWLMMATQGLSVSYISTSQGGGGNSTQSGYSHSYYIEPLVLPAPLAFSKNDFIVSHSTLAVTGSMTMMKLLGIYTLNGNTLSLLSSFVGGYFMSQNSQTAQTWSLWTGNASATVFSTSGNVSSFFHNVKLYPYVSKTDGAVTLSAGDYWIAHGFFTQSANANVFNYLWGCPNTLTLNYIGTHTSVTSRWQALAGQFSYTTTQQSTSTAGLPGIAMRVSIATTDITHVSSAQLRPIAQFWRAV